MEIIKKISDSFYEETFDSQRDDFISELRKYNFVDLFPHIQIFYRNEIFELLEEVFPDEEIFNYLNENITKFIHDYNFYGCHQPYDKNITWEEMSIYLKSFLDKLVSKYFTRMKNIHSRLFPVWTPLIYEPLVKYDLIEFNESNLEVYWSQFITNLQAGFNDGMVDIIYDQIINLFPNFVSRILKEDEKIIFDYIHIMTQRIEILSEIEITFRIYELLVKEDDLKSLIFISDRIDREFDYYNPKVFKGNEEIYQFLSERGLIKYTLKNCHTLLNEMKWNDNSFYSREFSVFLTHFTIEEIILSLNDFDCQTMYNNYNLEFLHEDLEKYSPYPLKKVNLHEEEMFSSEDEF
jgi:hypothetical protein